MYKTPASHTHLRGGVYYFVRRIPADLREFYSGDRISLSLRTNSISAADRSAKSISQRLDDYWMGLRLQKIDIPAISLLRTVAKADDDSSFVLSDALALYLKLKSTNRDKVFARTAHRNIG